MSKQTIITIKINEIRQIHNKEVEHKRQEHNNLFIQFDQTIYFG